MHLIEPWMKARGWQPWPFQRDAWDAYGRGEDGLIHVATGAGKTYAALGGPLDHSRTDAGGGLRIVYVTPLRALARDVEAAIALPLAELGSKWRVESRTGDTAAKVRARQSKALPEILVTTPESLALLIARTDARHSLKNVACVIVDEWHELVASKRGVLLQLTLSRLRAISPSLRTWGISATLADPLSAARALLPVGREPTLVRAAMPRPVVVDTLLPPMVDAFPWAGHLGLAMLPALIDSLDTTVSNLIFTNTRSQAERWHQALLAARPDWQALTALHHGSIDRAAREVVESGLKSGQIRIVVATSSLDLGVDFPEVERVFQVGSPKALGRFVQRAGRSAHRPLAACRMTCVPTNALELLEYVAARRQLAAGALEQRRPAGGTLDVLIQHLCTCALGGGFADVELFAEASSTAAYRDLSPEALAWCLDFVTTGGQVLSAYPAYQRVSHVDGRYELKDRRQATLHRLNIGTIVADEQAQVKYRGGKLLGRVDEAYVAKLKPGDRFILAGKTLELVKLHELTAYVRPSARRTGAVPSWQGTSLPLSAPLGEGVRELLSELHDGAATTDVPELVALAPIVDAQRRHSRLPRRSELLLETWRHRDGSYLFVHPMAGRAVHEAMGALLALRLSRRDRNTFAVMANDFGFALVAAKTCDFAGLLTPADLTEEGLAADLDETVDAAQLAKRRFREIARIAGLVPQVYWSHRKSGSAVHASAALLFSTLDRFDPGHLLVREAREEARAALRVGGELEAALARARAASWVWCPLTRPSPLAFPLIVEDIRARLGSETLEERVARMTYSWTKGGNADDGPASTAGRRGGRPASRARRPLGRPSDADRSRPPLG